MRGGAGNVLSRFFRLLFLVVAVSVIFALIIAWPSKKPIISPIVSPISSSALPVSDSQKIDNGGLKQAVEGRLKNSEGDFGIVILNLKTGENYSLNEHKSFEAGSLYKLWVMGAAFNKIEDGNWQKNTVFSEEIPILNEKFKIASESAERTEGSIELPVNVALQRMITISDNYSALLLAWKLRLSFVTSYLESHGFRESKVGGAESLPSTTAYDTALFLERLYRGDLASSQSNEDMLELLKGQQINRKLPKYLPQGTVIAHKTGELGLVSHDAGIVYSSKGDYIIVILSESRRPKDAEETISQISKSVYDYFQK